MIYITEWIDVIQNINLFLYKEAYRINLDLTYFISIKQKKCERLKL